MRGMIDQHGVKWEFLLPKEDIKKLKRRVNLEEKLVKQLRKLPYYIQKDEEN